MQLATMPQKQDNVFVYCAKGLMVRYRVDEIGQIGAQLAFFCILSIFPFLIFINAMLANLDISATELLLKLEQFLPVEGARIVADYMDYLAKSTSPSMFSISLIMSVFSAPSGAMALVNALNKAYRTTVKSTIESKVISVVLTLALCVELIVAAVFLSTGDEVLKNIFLRIGISLNINRSWIKIQTCFVIFLVYITLCLLYAAIPRKKIYIKHTIPGAVLAIVGLFLMTSAFGLYIKFSDNYSMVYGSLGGVIAFLVWLHLSGIIIVMGAELNSILEQRRDDATM